MHDAPFLVDYGVRVGRKLGAGGLFCRSGGPSLARPALHPWALVTAKQPPYSKLARVLI